jgi:hypothetical protein
LQINRKGTTLTYIGGKSKEPTEANNFRVQASRAQT